MVLFKTPAALENVSSKVLKEITHPDWLFGRRQFASQSKSHFKSESAVFAANNILVVVERRITVGDEVEMVDSAISALIGADAIEGIGTTEHVLDDCPPVFRLLPEINSVKSRVDSVPARGRSVLTSIATFVFNDVHTCHTSH